jgi:hypothetical protein
MGHKGPVLRPRCIRTRRAGTQTPFNSIHGHRSCSSSSCMLFSNILAVCSSPNIKTMISGYRITYEYHMWITYAFVLCTTLEHCHIWHRINQRLCQPKFTRLPVTFHCSITTALIPSTINYWHLDLFQVTSVYIPCCVNRIESAVGERRTGCEAKN